MAGTAVVTVRLSKEIEQALSAGAEAAHTSRGELVREIVEQWVKDDAEPAVHCSVCGGEIAIDPNRITHTRCLAPSLQTVVPKGSSWVGPLEPIPVTPYLTGPDDRQTGPLTPRPAAP